MNSTARRPDTGEYVDYYDRYVRLVPDGDIVGLLRAQAMVTNDLLRGLAPGLAEFRYEPGKWSLKEVLGHVIDAEWIFTYRALSFARGQESPLPGMDQDVFMARANPSAWSMPALLEQFRHLRAANTLLFDTFDDSILDRKGTASGFPFTVRALLYVIAGHELHHVNVVRERYLVRTP